MKRERGFTLIEIAIVLVIIGLLLGGILKGQEMITQARIRNVVNDLNSVSVAYYAYQDRYRAIPGDDPNANGRWTGTTSGDGNGQVDGNFNATPSANPPPAGQESNLFWQHLRLAGLVAGPTTGAGSANPPQNAVGGVTGVQNGALGLSGLVVCTSNLPGKIANAVDSQLDDGKPSTGSLRGTTTSPLPATAPTDTSYVDDGATQYTICKNI